MSDGAGHERKALWQGISLGLIAAAVFSLTFVLNRLVALDSGHWAWSSSLRYLIMLPVLAMVITARRKWPQFIRLWRASPLGWVFWGTLATCVFYSAMTAACAVMPAWVVAATWPVAIVIGILIGPFIYQGERRNIPGRALVFSMVILLGIGLLQVGQMQTGLKGDVFLGLALVLLSATAQPIGNRMSMVIVERSGIGGDPFLRLSLAITGSIPAFLLLSLWGGLEAGMPGIGQIKMIGILAVVGLISTPLFFAATDRVGKVPSSLAAVEATQAGEIVFTLVLEALILGIHPPDHWGLSGLVLILSGILMHAIPKRTRRVSLPV